MGDHRFGDTGDCHPGCYDVRVDVVPRGASRVEQTASGHGENTGVAGWFGDTKRLAAVSWRGGGYHTGHVTVSSAYYQPVAYDVADAGYDTPGE